MGAKLGFIDFRESVKAIKENPVMATEMLEVTDYQYSPTTMYEDYPLNEYLFCKKILLFVREQNKDEFGLAMSYVFLGEASFVKSICRIQLQVRIHLTVKVRL